MGVLPVQSVLQSLVPTLSLTLLASSAFPRRPADPPVPPEPVRPPVSAIELTRAVARSPVRGAGAHGAMLAPDGRTRLEGADPRLEGVALGY